MTFTFHRISPGDAALFATIAPDVFDEPVRADRLAAYLADANVLMVVARDENRVVGQCAGVIHHHPDKPDDLYVDEVGVTPSHQRRGVARAMVRELFAWAREVGCASGWVATEADNEPACALYAGFGARGLGMVYFDFLLTQDDPDGVDQPGEIAQ